MDNEGYHSRKLKDRYLAEKLGEYLNAKQIRGLTNINPSRLIASAQQGKVQGTQLKGKWYYSIESVTKAIKSGLI